MAGGSLCTQQEVRTLTCGEKSLHHVRLPEEGGLVEGAAFLRLSGGGGDVRDAQSSAARGDGERAADMEITGEQVASVSPQTDAGSAFCDTLRPEVMVVTVEWQERFVDTLMRCAVYCATVRISP